MPQITNTFLKSKMNKDLDSRILPNGEYRDAQNLQISRSEGSEVGEFENIPGNTELRNLYTGLGSKFIGQFTNETSGDIFLYNSGYTQNDICPRDVVVYFQGFIGGDRKLIQIEKASGTAYTNYEVLGIEVGMLLWGDSWGPSSLPSGDNGYKSDALVIDLRPNQIALNQDLPGNLQPGDKIYIGFNNTIHRYNPISDSLDLLVRGDFLNFSQKNRITGINLIDDLLFWTDNRNQPRKINVSLANPQSLPSPTHYVNEDQISVAKYYPYRTPLVLEDNKRSIIGGAQAVSPLKGYVCDVADTTGIKIGDIASGFPDQGDQELWNVISIDPNVSVTIYNNFKDGDLGQGMSPGSFDGANEKANVSFKRPSVKNLANKRQTNGFETTAQAAGAVVAGNDIVLNYSYYNKVNDQSAQPTPRVGDFIISETLTGPSGVGITIADEVVIQSVEEIGPSTVPAPVPATSITLQLTKDVTVNAIGDDVTVAANPDYDSQFTGDPDLVEEKFIRFSYRFKFEDNEYSLAAPYTQICFIPKHNGLFGGGQNETLQDMKDAYDSTIVEWFTNNIDTVSLKIPLPSISNSTSAEVIDNLISEYKITNIEILYKESDALSTKILESIQVDDTILSSFLQLIPQASIVEGPEWYYNFDYKSIKAFRTLPTSEQNRVYDNVPIKALAQEITANRVMYGNFLQKHTPPNGIDYEIINEDKSVAYDNYAQYPYHTVKQDRSYQAGFVLSDRYGRASSVVLSTNDSTPGVAGSTLYVPYKTFGELDDPITDVTTYKWLGNALRLKINNGVTQITNNSQTGEPGLYKSWTDTSVDIVTVTAPGVSYIVGQEISFNSGEGDGVGFRIKVETVDGAGGVTGLSIISSGENYVDGQILDNNIIITGSGLKVQVTVNPPNVLGWQSYKLVVKQQEQEYYNVYLPGYISGYPIKTATDYGRIAFASLFGDNINKVPRDLNEVGPTQSEFSSSVGLIGRVNNPNIDNNQKGGVGNFYYENRNYAWNCQYYPGRLKDEAVTIGPVGEGGLELANSPFDNTSSKAAFTNSAAGTGPHIPWGDAGEVQSFYNVEQNPLAVVVKIGAEDTQLNLTQPGSPQLNTLGARVTVNGTFPVPVNDIGCMYPFLSVSETEPVESLLEIFYETSTSGNFVDLNDAVLADYGGVTKTSLTLGSFDEDVPSGTNIITSFDFQDSAGNTLVLDGDPAAPATNPPDIGVIITQVLDSNGNDVTGIFSINASVAGSYDKFDLKTNDLFWYGYSSGTKSNQWFVSFQTSYQAGTFIDVLSNEITINLNNIAPTIGGFTPAQTSDLTQLNIEQACSKPGGTAGYDTTMTGDFGQFTNAKNGSADVTNETQDLCYTLSVTSEPVGSTAIWAISQDGTLSLTSGTLVNGTYVFECTVTDAASSCVLDAGSLSTTCEYELLFGTPPTNQAICFGPTSAMSSLDTSCNYINNSGGLTHTGQPLEVFFGANRFVSDAFDVGVTGSGTSVILQDIDNGFVPSKGSFGYGLSSGSNFNLRYYNVLQEGNPNFTSSPPAFNCVTIPPTVPPDPNFTTGALTQGIMAIQAILTKSVSIPGQVENSYRTAFTILYRADSSAAWTLATCLAFSPSKPAGGTIGNFNELDVDGAGATTASQTYFFQAVGEYAVRNNGVSSVGCNECSVCAEFTVNYYDAGQTQPVNGCTDCLGPL